MVYYPRKNDQNRLKWNWRWQRLHRNKNTWLPLNPAFIFINLLKSWVRGCVQHTAENSEDKTKNLNLKNYYTGSVTLSLSLELFLFLPENAHCLQPLDKSNRHYSLRVLLSSRRKNIIWPQLTSCVPYSDDDWQFQKHIISHVTWRHGRGQSCATAVWLADEWTKFSVYTKRFSLR